MGSRCLLDQVGAVAEGGRWGFETPEASSSLTSTEPDLASGTNLSVLPGQFAAAMTSTFRSSVRGVASLGVVAWLVSVSYVTGTEMEELHREEGQQESQEQLELQEHTPTSERRAAPSPAPTNAAPDPARRYLLSELKEEGPSLSRRCSSGPWC